MRIYGPHAAGFTQIGDESPDYKQISLGNTRVF